MAADFAWEVLLLDALGIDDPDHADGPSDLLPLVRWAVEEARCFRAGLEQIVAIIEAVPSHVWENGEIDGDPLWEALDQIDGIVTGVGPEVRRAFQQYREVERLRAMVDLYDHFFDEAFSDDPYLKGSLDGEWDAFRRRHNGRAETPPEPPDSGSDDAGGAA